MYNKKNIFNKAWQLYYDNPGSLFSECLKESWIIEKDIISNIDFKLQQEKEKIENELKKERKNDIVFTKRDYELAKLFNNAGKKLFETIPKEYNYA